MKRPISDRALWLLFNALAFAVVFAALAIRSLWGLPA